MDRLTENKGGGVDGQTDREQGGGGVDGQTDREQGGE